MKGVKFGRHDPEETFLEGLVSRSDRRAADLLEAAFRKGCRLDAWGEHLRFDLWQEAIEEVQFDVHHALRERSIDERLPWDHIDIFMPKKWFQEDWERAKVLEHAQDCRHKKCHRCGVIDEERELCASMLRDNIEARKTEAAWTKTPTPERVEPPQIQRLRLRISRLGASRYLSHLESMNAWIRGLRRAKTPLSYSQGFHPHPRVSFSSANPVGQESMGDYMDIVLVERVSPSELMNTLNETLPNGFGVIAIQEIPLRSPALMSVQQGTQYSVFLDGLNLGEVKERLAEVLSRKAIEVERMGKVRAPKKRGKRGRYRVKVPKIVDIRPMIREAEIVANERPSLEIELISVDGKPGKIREILPLLVDIPSSLHVLKRDTLVAESQGQWVSVSSGWSDDSEGISS